MNIQVILTVTVLLTLAVAAGARTIASAQYFGNMGVGGETGANTLEEVLKIKSEQVNIVWPTPGEGPILEPPPHRMLVFMVTALLGGIAAIFFHQGKVRQVRRRRKRIVRLFFRNKEDSRR